MIKLSPRLGFVMGFSKIPSRPGITVATSKCDGFGRRSQNHTKFFVSRFMMGFLKIPSQNRLQIFLSAKTRHKNPCKLFCRQKPVAKIRAIFLSTKTITKSLAFFVDKTPLQNRVQIFVNLKSQKHVEIWAFTNPLEAEEIPPTLTL